MNEVIEKLKTVKSLEELKVFTAKLEKEENKKRQRTGQQNRALHLYFRLIAEALNESGWHLKKFLEHKSKAEINWTEKNFKEVVWRQIQQAVLGKNSTTELSKQEDIDKVYEHVNRLTSDPPIGVHVPFPHDSERYKIEHESRKVADIPYPEYDEDKHSPTI